MRLRFKVCKSAYAIGLRRSAGYQKGKIWGYYLPAGMICLIYIIITEYDAKVKGGMFMTELLIYASEHILAVSGSLLALGAMLLGISYLLSVWIYGRREF